MWTKASDRNATINKLKRDIKILQIIFTVFLAQSSFHLSSVFPRTNTGVRESVAAIEVQNNEQSVTSVAPTQTNGLRVCDCVSGSCLLESVLLGGRLVEGEAGAGQRSTPLSDELQHILALGAVGRLCSHEKLVPVIFVGRSS